MHATVRTFAALLFLLILSGCSTAPADIGRDRAGFTESGQASYYADKHQNGKTASGELYKHDLKTAAHRMLPFGTQVKVTNTDNGKSVTVRINDRGPLAKGRIIDLSKSAFSSIGNISSGLINVTIEVVP